MSSTKISLNAAIEILKNVFDVKSPTDTTRFSELIANRSDRLGKSPETNRSWTNSITQKLIHHGLVTKVNEIAGNPRSKIIGIKLTQKGKKALVEASTTPTATTPEPNTIAKPRIINIDEAVLAIEEWRIKNPWATKIGHESGWEIVFKQKGADG